MKIPSLINDAESHYGSGNGSLKKGFVIYSVLDFICDKVGITISQIPSMIHDVVAEQVEAILACPVRKKGDNNVLQGKIV